MSEGEEYLMKNEGKYYADLQILLVQRSMRMGNNTGDCVVCYGKLFKELITKEENHEKL